MVDLIPMYFNKRGIPVIDMMCIMIQERHQVAVVVAVI
jgi:hypothetical protein